MSLKQTVCIAQLKKKQMKKANTVELLLDELLQQLWNN